MITLEKISDSSYYMYFNKIYLGDVIQDESGFYNFFFSNDNKGYWTSHSLRLIAEKLDELNKEWNDEILKSLK